MLIPLCAAGFERARLWLQGLEDTTKARDGFQRVPLMHGIGAAQFVDDLTKEEVTAAATYVSARHQAATGKVNTILPLPAKGPAQVPGLVSGQHLRRMVAIGAA